MKIPREEHNLKGHSKRPFRVDDIFEEAAHKVSNIYPDAEMHGRLFHWEWAICLSGSDDVIIVAEAWPNTKEGGWYLRIKERK